MGEAVVEVGSTANNYQILARLATGGMAEIFLARGVSATGVERYCVLKRILRNRASDVSFVRMFLDEARLAAQLQHPNIAQVYDIGKLGDSYFFTMEYVHGETVRQIMQRARSLRRELPLAAVLTIAAGAASGLHHAHERIGIDGRPLTIVHRDVSPSNLMVSYEGTVKVVDFGVAKASDRANETRSGTVKGKISYLSPEQARGSSSIDRRSDLFSLGIVLWELLTMERLYKRNSDFENMTAIVNEPTPPPSSRKKWIPPELDALVLKLLAKDAKDRYQTADDFVEALESFAGRSGAMISSSSLARFLRDMFGQRPEPWVELDTAEVPEGVTVTSEPVPGGSDLAIPVGANEDLQLDIVPRLDLERPVRQVSEGGLPTPLIGVHDDHLPTRPHPKVDPMNATLNDASPPPPRPTVPMRSSAPRIGGSGPQSQPPPMSQSTSGSIPIYPRARPSDLDRSDVRAVEPSKGVAWQLIAVIAIAAIVGSLTMFLVMRDKHGSTPVDAGVVAKVEIDAATHVVLPPPPVTIDAAVEVAQVEIDAAVAVPDPPPEPPAVKPKQPEAKPQPKKSAIEAAWDNGNYRDVVARCAKAFPNSADDVRCVTAACKLHNTPKARSFLAKLDKPKRKKMIEMCKGYDVDLDEAEKKPEKNPCDADPMSCQH